MHLYEKTCCSLLIINFAEFTVYSDEYEHVYKGWFIVYKFTVYTV